MTSEQGRGRGYPKADAVRKLSKEGCVKMPTGGMGIKKSENVSDVTWKWPLILILPSFLSN